jgi:quinohemoprotein ethanol dehydrogenase
VATASKTWSGEYWKTGTGGGPWGAITYDAELNRVYIGTGNAGPWNPEVRSPGGGDNLFVSSIVAVDADTGKYIWHYQINPRDSWDFKACMDIALTHVLIDGRDRRVLIQSPTNGFFYVIDRDTGKLISAEKTGKVTWAKRIDLASGRPVEIPNAHYQNGPITFWPSPLGAHNWQSMSYSPQTGLAYIPYMKSAVKFEARPDGSGFGLGVHATFMKIDDDDFTGKLLAWDPIAQKARWSVPRNLMWNGGIASTAGNLVFQGDANGIFHAYNANSGRALWDFDAKLGIVGSPISYMVGGRQYISILVGFGGATGNITQFNNYGWKYGEQPRRLLTFALDGRSKLPPTAPRRFEMKPMDDQKLVIDIAAATTGAALYGSKGCSICHGDNVKSDGNPAPDLQESRVALDYQAFVAFLRSGAAAQNGMPQFDFSDDEARSIFMYIRLAARDMLTGKTTIKRERGSSL